MLPLTDAGEADQDTLRDYSILEYNAIFDRKGRSAFFFPAPEQP